MTKVSVVVPVYNGARTIGLALDALLAQTVKDLEIIVADDGSTDNTAELVRARPVKYLRQENAGPAKARNLGWRAASGEIIFFTDSDCVPEPEWVAKLLRAFADPAVSAAGGTYGIKNPESLVAQCIHYDIQYRHARLGTEVAYLGSFSLALRRTALEAAGGFDESFRIACGEDADLSYRLYKAGHRFRFDKNCLVFHHFPVGFTHFCRQQFWRGYWIMKLLARHGSTGAPGYSNFLDALQPPLFALALAALAAAPLLPAVRTAALVLNLLAFAVNLPSALFGVRASGSPRLLFSLVLFYFRGFAWVLGLAYGSGFLLSRGGDKK
ncbi:MAG: glycosyltransferase [Elusimicrobiales bacterium]|nr:glycosyltransferase [Elusimicrobiales bacterium]